MTPLEKLKYHVSEAIKRGEPVIENVIADGPCEFKAGQIYSASGAYLDHRGGAVYIVKTANGWKAQTWHGKFIADVQAELIAAIKQHETVELFEE